MSLTCGIEMIGSITVRENQCIIEAFAIITSQRLSIDRTLRNKFKKESEKTQKIGILFTLTISNMHAPRTITLSDGNWTKKIVFIPGTCDQFVVREVLIDECYAFTFKKDDVVLDLGGNIGSFCVYAFDRVKQIFTFEPDVECFQRLEYHLSENNIKNVYAYNLAI